MVMGMEITQSQEKMLPLCTVCVKAKMTRQLHQDAKTHLSQPGFCLYANVGGGEQTYTTFQGFYYFVLFICKAIDYV